MKFQVGYKVKINRKDDNSSGFPSTQKIDEGFIESVAQEGTSVKPYGVNSPEIPYIGIFDEDELVLDEPGLMLRSIAGGKREWFKPELPKLERYDHVPFGDVDFSIAKSWVGSNGVNARNEVPLPRYAYKTFDEKKNYWYIVKSEGEEPHWVDVGHWTEKLGGKNALKDTYAYSTASYENIVPGNPSLSKESLEEAKRSMFKLPGNEGEAMGNGNQLKVGYKCRIISGRCGTVECYKDVGINKGYVLITGINSQGSLSYDIYNNNDVRVSSCNGCYTAENLEVITKSGNLITNIMDKFLALFEGEPTKSYKKVGIYDANGIPTDNGMRMFLKYVLDSKSDLATAFQTDVVAKLVAEEEKKNK